MEIIGDLLAQFGIDPLKVAAAGGLAMLLTQAVKKLWPTLEAGKAQIVSLIVSALSGIATFYQSGWAAMGIGAVVTSLVSLLGYDLLVKAPAKSTTAEINKTIRINGSAEVSDK